MTRRPGAPGTDTGTPAGQLLLLTAGLGLLSMLGVQGSPLIPTSIQEVRGSERVGWGDECGPGQAPALGQGPSPVAPTPGGLGHSPLFVSLGTSPGKGEGFLQGLRQRGSVRPQTDGS